MAAAISFSVGVFSLVVWFQDRKAWSYLMFFLTAIAAAWFAVLDAWSFNLDKISDHVLILKLSNTAVFMVLNGLVWFIYDYFKTARFWLAILFTMVWSILLIDNYLAPNSLIYDTITGIKQISVGWGEHIHRITGTRNPWSYLADLMSFVFLIYVADATVKLWKKGAYKKAGLIGGSILLFMLAAGIHTPLVDVGYVSSPYLITFAFLFIVAAMGFEISYDVIRSSKLSKEVIANERRWRSLLENVHLLVVELDRSGNIKYVNPFFLKLCGYQNDEVIGYNWFDKFIPSKDQEKTLKTFQSVHNNEQQAIFQNAILLKNGEERKINWSNVHLYNPEGQNYGTISIGADITEQISAFSEIEELKDRLQEENIYLREEIILDHNYRDIIGKSDTLKYALTRVEQVAQTDMTVLIEGETGVGKELFARAIHSNSSRKNRPMVKINCAAIPVNLLESELFGYEKGAFTGAHKLHKGRFELADGGSIFLDEIGEVPPEVQSKLLQVIEEGTFDRIGGTGTIKVDVRIIAATNRILKDEVASGRFREDLYFRLNAYPISIPPLRKRSEDIPLIVESFVDQFSRKVGKKITKTSKNTIEMLKNYNWPGNVRELQNVIERAILITDSDKITIGNLNGSLNL